MSFSYNAEGVEMGGKFSPAPAGIYSLVIEEAKEKTTKKGDRMVSAKCSIDDAGEYLGRTVWHNVTFLPKERKGAGMALEFLKAIGEPYEGLFDVDADNWKGKTFKAKVGIEKDLKGIDRNTISFLLKQGEDDSEVPF